MLRATPYDVEGHELGSGAYCPLTNSLFRAVTDTDFPVIVMSQHFALVGKDNVRWLISREQAA